MQGRKRRCDRQYPCNHCTRRRRPEECVYGSPPVNGPSCPSLPADQPETQPPQPVESARPMRETAEDDSEAHWSREHSALARSFGYFEDSNSNTMALLRQLELPDQTDTQLNNASPSTWDTIQCELDLMPDRQIVDFLVQYFVYELNWMKQVIHAPSFLASYQLWWAKNKITEVADVEFAALITRICSYATQFLPSPSHTVDQIRGRSLADIRDTCSNIGNNLATACEILDWKGTLVRVQHIIFAALKVSCEGRTSQFWEGIGSACRAAQKAGIHTDTTSLMGSQLPKDSAQELNRDIQRRTFCSLYVLDSHLSRQLDRIPFLPDHLVEETLPRLRLIPDISNIPTETATTAPDIFTERLMQVQLGLFWRGLGLQRTSEFDPTESERRYEKLNSEYLANLHPAFAIAHPDTTLDKAIPKLPMQRQLLHIAIFDSICWNFRPLLLLKPNQVASLAPYKRVLLRSQKQRLGMAALKVLEAVATLHAMFGGSYTRFSAIIFNSFEPAILLLNLCSNADFPFDQDDHSTDLMGIKVRMTYRIAMQAVEQAIRRLQMLADLSDMAASGARVATLLFARCVQPKQSPSPLALTSSGSGSLGSTQVPTPIERYGEQEKWPSLEAVDHYLMPDNFSSMAQEHSFPSPQLSSLEFPTLWGEAFF
ncbi:Transcription factor XilB [Penicillium crustosum]|nr:transcription factor XilB [Penicillium crustosum]